MGYLFKMTYCRQQELFQCRTQYVIKKMTYCGQLLSCKQKVIIKLPTAYDFSNLSVGTIMSKVDTSWAEDVTSSVQAGASYACQICLIVRLVSKVSKDQLMSV